MNEQQTAAVSFTLTIGEWYDYSTETDTRTMQIVPVGGVFLGYLKPLGFLVFQGADVDGEGTGEVVYVNPSEIFALRPETFPKELS